jgi:CheY-like chemotaxis protein
MTKQLLKRFPFQLDSFSDAAVCAPNSEGTPFDVILMDMQMPVMAATTAVLENLPFAVQTP